MLSSLADVVLATMYKHLTIALATLAFSTGAFADGFDLPVGDFFQIAYAANLNVGDSFVNFTNSGNTVVNGASQNICINLYTFDPQEELISCCTCTVTPNGLVSLSVVKSLISNPLTPAIPTAVVIKAIATTACIGTGQFAIAHGLLGWGTTLHQNTSTAAPTYSVSEVPFSPAAINEALADHLVNTCGFIQANGSGFGICAGCPSNGLGAATTSNQ